MTVVLRLIWLLFVVLLCCVLLFVDAWRCLWCVLVVLIVLFIVFI